MRHRDLLVQTAGTYVQRMQKALTQMNLLLPRVVSDIVGKTGLAILRALVAGERDPHVLAQHRDPHCKAPAEAIVAALTGLRASPAATATSPTSISGPFSTTSPAST